MQTQTFAYLCNLASPCKSLQVLPTRAARQHTNASLVLFCGKPFGYNHELKTGFAYCCINRASRKQITVFEQAFAQALKPNARLLEDVMAVFKVELARALDEVGWTLNALNN